MTSQQYYNNNIKARWVPLNDSGPSQCLTGCPAKNPSPTDWFRVASTSAQPTSSDFVVRMNQESVHFKYDIAYLTTDSSLCMEIVITKVECVNPNTSATFIVHPSNDLGELINTPLINQVQPSYGVHEFWIYAETQPYTYTDVTGTNTYTVSECSVAAGFDTKPLIIRVTFKVGLDLTQTTTNNFTPVYYTKDFQMLYLTPVLNLSYTNTATSFDISAAFINNYDAATNTSYNWLKKTSCNFTWTCTNVSVLQAILGYDYCAQSFTTSATNSNQVVLKDYSQVRAHFDHFRRVSGSYILSYTATHPATGLTANNSVTVSVQNNCNVSSVNLATQSVVEVIPYKNSTPTNLLSYSTLTQPACQFMSLNKTLKLRIKAVYYGSANTVVVNSFTNTSKYNIFLGTITPNSVPGLCGTCTFVDQTRLTIDVAGMYDTADTTLAAWEMSPVNLAFKIFKINLIASSETFSAVLGASPDQPFTLDAKTKFSTNMDGNGNFPYYDKQFLSYTYSCTNPTVGSNPTAAAANNCCALVFSWSGTVATKSYPSSPNFCDGTYTLTITAKNSAFPSYTETYTATINVKYDCLYLKNSGVFYTPTGGLIHWPGGTSASASTVDLLTYKVGDPLIDITHQLVHGSDSYSHSCAVQYDFTCVSSNPNCSQFSNFFQKSTSSALVNSNMQASYPLSTQLRVLNTTNNLFTTYFNSYSIQINAYIFSTDTVPTVTGPSQTDKPQYGGKLEYKATISWLHTLSITSSCLYQTTFSFPSVLQISQETTFPLVTPISTTIVDPALSCQTTFELLSNQQNVGVPAFISLDNGNIQISEEINNSNTKVFYLKIVATLYVTPVQTVNRLFTVAVATCVTTQINLAAGSSIPTGTYQLEMGKSDLKIDLPAYSNKDCDNEFEVKVHLAESASLPSFMTISNNQLIVKAEQLGTYHMRVEAVDLVYPVTNSEVQFDVQIIDCQIRNVIFDSATEKTISQLGPSLEVVVKMDAVHSTCGSYQVTPSYGASILSIVKTNSSQLSADDPSSTQITDGHLKISADLSTSIGSQTISVQIARIHTGETALLSFTLEVTACQITSLSIQVGQNIEIIAGITPQPAPFAVQLVTSAPDCQYPYTFHQGSLPGQINVVLTQTGHTVVLAISGALKTDHGNYSATLSTTSTPSLSVSLLISIIDPCSRSIFTEAFPIKNGDQEFRNINVYQDSKGSQQFLLAPVLNFDRNPLSGCSFTSTVVSSALFVTVSSTNFLQVNEAKLPNPIAEHIKVFDFSLVIRSVNFSTVQRTYLFTITAIHPCTETVLEPVVLSDMAESIHYLRPYDQVFMEASDSVSKARSKLNYCGKRVYTCDDSRISIRESSTGVGQLILTYTPVDGQLEESVAFTVNQKLEFYPEVPAVETEFTLTLFDDCAETVISKGIQQIEPLAFVHTPTITAPVSSSFQSFYSSIAEKYKDHGLCGPYEYKIAEDYSFVKLLPPTNFDGIGQITVSTKNAADSGTYKLTLLGRLTNYPSVQPGELSFDVTISFTEESPIFVPAQNVIGDESYPKESGSANATAATDAAAAKNSTCTQEDCRSKCSDKDEACLKACDSATVDCEAKSSTNSTTTQDQSASESKTQAKAETKPTEKTASKSNSDPKSSAKAKATAPIQTSTWTKPAVVLSKNELDSALKKFDDIIIEVPKVIPPLMIAVQPVTPSGVLVVQFNREIKLNPEFLIAPARELQAQKEGQDAYVNKMLERAFDIRYQPALKEDEDVQPAQFLGFNLTEFKENKEIVFQLVFDDPLLVSAIAMSEQNKDVLIVSLNTDKAFNDPLKNVPVEATMLQDSELQLPKLLPDTDSAALSKVDKSAKSTVSMGVPGLFVVNLMIGANLNYIWSAINILSFVIFIENWKLYLPPNLEMFIKQIGYFARLEFLPRDKIMTVMRISLEKDDDGNAKQTKFLLAVAQLLAILLVSLALTYFLLYQCRTNSLAKMIIDYIVSTIKSFFWNGIIRYIIQCYLNYTVFVLLMFTNKEAKDLVPTFEKTTSILIQASILIFLIAIVPIMFFTMLYRKFNSLDEKAEKDKYGSLWEGVREKHFDAVIYYVVFMLRRLLFACITVLLGPFFGEIGLVTSVSLSTIYLCYLLHVSPKSSPSDNQLEIASEILLVYCFITVMMIQTQSSPRARYSLGWASVANACALVGILYINLLFRGVKGLIRDMIRYYKMYKPKIKDLCSKKKAVAEKAKRQKVEDDDESFRFKFKERPVFTLRKTKVDNQESKLLNSHPENVNSQQESQQLIAEQKSQLVTERPTKRPLRQKRLISLIVTDEDPEDDEDYSPNNGVYASTKHRSDLSELEQICEDDDEERKESGKRWLDLMTEKVTSSTGSRIRPVVTTYEDLDEESKDSFSRELIELILEFGKPELRITDEDVQLRRQAYRLTDQDLDGVITQLQQRDNRCDDQQGN